MDSFATRVEPKTKESDLGRRKLSHEDRSPEPGVSMGAHLVDARAEAVSHRMLQDSAGQSVQGREHAWVQLMADASRRQVALRSRVFQLESAVQLEGRGGGSDADVIQMAKMGSYTVDLAPVIKWNQLSFYGMMPWIMFGGNPHISVYPSDGGKFAIMALKQEGAEVDNEWLMKNMEFDEIHVTIGGKHNYFTPDGQWLAASASGAESDKGTKQAAIAYLASHYSAREEEEKAAEGLMEMEEEKGQSLPESGGGTDDEYDEGEEAYWDYVDRLEYERD